MKFDDWYNNAYPDTVGKHDGFNRLHRSTAVVAWEAGIEQLAAKVLKILTDDRKGPTCKIIKAIEKLEEG